MNAAGAEALRLRIEQQEHWRSAAAVRDGLQPGVDPDSHALVEIGYHERTYEAEAGRFTKRMVRGVWKLDELPHSEGSSASGLRIVGMDGARVDGALGVQPGPPRAAGAPAA